MQVVGREVSGDKFWGLANGGAGTLLSGALLLSNHWALHFRPWVWEAVLSAWIVCVAGLLVVVAHVAWVYLRDNRKWSLGARLVALAASVFIVFVCVGTILKWGVDWSDQQSSAYPPADIGALETVLHVSAVKDGMFDGYFIIHNKAAKQAKLNDFGRTIPGQYMAFDADNERSRIVYPNHSTNIPITLNHGPIRVGSTVILQFDYLFGKGPKQPAAYMTFDVPLDTKVGQELSASDCCSKTEDLQVAAMEELERSFGDPAGTRLLRQVPIKQIDGTPLSWPLQADHMRRFLFDGANGNVWFESLAGGHRKILVGQLLNTPGNLHEVQLAWDDRQGKIAMTVDGEPALPVHQEGNKYVGAIKIR